MSTLIDHLTRTLRPVVLALLFAAACGPSTTEPSGPLAQDASSIEPLDGSAHPADASAPGSAPGNDPSAPSDASVSVGDASMPVNDASAPVRDASVPVSDASTGMPAQDAATPPPDCVPKLVVNLRSQLDLCRTCHVKGGLAEEALYLLTEQPTDDEARLRVAHTALGRDLLNVPAQQNGRTHDAGRLVTPGSAGYAAWDALLKALADPVQGCRP